MKSFILVVIRLGGVKLWLQLSYCKRLTAYLLRGKVVGSKREVNRAESVGRKQSDGEAQPEGCKSNIS